MEKKHNFTCFKCGKGIDKGFLYDWEIYCKDCIKKLTQTPTRSHRIDGKGKGKGRE